MEGITMGENKAATNYYSIIITAIVTVCLSLILGRVLNWFLVNPKLQERRLKKQGIPGPPYKIWADDNRVKMVKLMMMQQSNNNNNNNLPHDILPRLNPLMYHSMKEHGKMFYLWMGTVPRIMLMEPKLIREMLTDKSGDFRKPENNAFTRLFHAGLSTLNGDRWSMHKKIINPSFHLDKLKGMLPSFSMCIEGTISKWEGELGSKDSCEMDVFSEFQKLTADIISRVAFGSSYEEGSKVFQLLNEQGKLLSKAFRVATYPWLRFLPTEANVRMKQIYDEVRTTLRGIIKKREKTIDMGNNNGNDDLLGLMLESNLKEKSESKNSRGSCGMTLDEVIEECKLFYFAGHETSATLLTWAIIALSMDQEWQERAREEVLTVLGCERKPSFDDLARLKIVTMVLQETMRLYPLASIMRTTGRKGAKLGDKYLPSDVEVFVALPFVHRDEEEWGEDVLEFNPKRFSEGVLKASSRKDQAPYFPFGIGPRTCIGQNLGMLEAKMALSMMLQRFCFQLSPSYSHTPFFFLTLQPLRGAPVIIRRLHAS